MQFTTNKTLFILLFSILFISTSSAEIYRYQDKNGRWQFSDKPVGKTKGKLTVSPARTKKPGVDLNGVLLKKFNPKSEVDLATLAVVMIETKTGTGSGFFITKDGYMITNRHVVRPSTSTGWKEEKDKLVEVRLALDDRSSSLENEEERLTEMKLLIEEDKEYMESRHAKEVEISRYKRFIKKYKRDKESYEKEVKNHKEKEKKYRNSKSEFGWKSSVSNFSKKFNITLKNGKKYKAKLIKISKTHDLALLKLDHFVTPFISISDSGVSRQGDSVYAIGSPLGISDSLTSGIITKKDSEHLVTDARILPGNSGGPLVNKDGRLLGINTAVVSQDKYAEGLGLAIYAKYIQQEFKGKF